MAGGGNGRDDGDGGDSEITVVNGIIHPQKIAQLILLVFLCSYESTGYFLFSYLTFTH